MARPNSSSAREAAYSVEPPKVSDAIGRSLRNAYDDDVRVPDDFTTLLASLDAKTRRAAH